VAVIVVYASRQARAYDRASRAGNGGIGLAFRPTLRGRAATQENGKDNPNPYSVLFHKVPFLRDKEFNATQ
jgi:hypothetical protein